MTLGLSGIWVFLPSVRCSSGWLRYPMGCQGTCSTKVSKEEITSDVQLKQNQKQAQRSQFSVEFLSVWGSTPNYFKLVCILQIHKLKKGGGDCLLKNSHHFQRHKNKNAIHRKVIINIRIRPATWQDSHLHSKCVISKCVFRCVFKYQNYL